MDTTEQLVVRELPQNVVCGTTLQGRRRPTSGWDEAAPQVMLDFGPQPFRHRLGELFEGLQAEGAWRSTWATTWCGAAGRHRQGARTATTIAAFKQSEPGGGPGAA
jgi:hypothetical protein